MFVSPLKSERAITRFQVMALVDLGYPIGSHHPSARLLSGSPSRPLNGSSVRVMVASGEVTHEARRTPLTRPAAPKPDALPRAMVY
jgi:hypothetical protein